MLIGRAQRRGGGGDGDGSGQVGSGGRPVAVILVGAAASESCLCGWFQFPLCPRPFPSTDFLTFHCFGLSPQSSVELPQDRSALLVKSHMPPGKTGFDLNRRLGFRVVASLPLDPPGKLRGGTVAPGLNLHSPDTSLHGSLKTRNLLLFVRIGCRVS